jgi:hypothetical protein
VLQIETPPASIANDCTSNVTTALTDWFDSTLPNTAVLLPAGACYLVNPVTNPVTGLTRGLTLNKLSGLTIIGNGAIFRQTAYPCDGSVDPVLTLTRDTNVTVHALTIDGPGNCPGNEGDAGIYLGQATPGDANISFDGVTIENTNGDGLAVYPQLRSCCGINTNVTFENGAMSNIGYHTFTLEGVNGLTIENNTFTSVTDMDMEVDIGQYGPPFNTCTDTADQGLTGVAQCNISIIGNHFVSSQFGIESSSNGACIPHGNFKIENNTFTNGSSLALQIEGSQSAACPRDNGLTITGNTVVPDSAIGGGAGGWYSCSITTAPCGAALDIADYQNVTIENNQFLMQAGNPGYGANTIYTRSLAFQGDANVTIKDNGFNNGWNVWSGSGAQWAHTEYPNVNITECGNAYWLTKPMPDDYTGTTPAASPQYDAPC